MRLRIAAFALSALAGSLTAQDSTEIATAGPKTTDFAPLEYFQTKCARCHGDYGAAYGSEFAKNLTDERLFEIVAEMAEGPAQAPLTDPQLAVETEFHRALRDGQPFAAVVSWDAKNGLLSGEALPGTKLSLRDGGKTVEIPLNGHAWKIALPAATDWKTVQLIAHKGEKEITLPLAERAFPAFSKAPSIRTPTQP